MRVVLDRRSVFGLVAGFGVEVLRFQSGIGPEADSGGRAGWFGAGGGFSFDTARALHAVAGEKLAGQLEVSLSPAGTGIVEGDGLAMAWRFGKADIARNDGLKQALPEVFAEGVSHLLGEIGSVVIHGEEHAFDVDVGVDGR